MARYLVLGVLGFTGWNWARVQPTSSPFRQTVDQIRGWLKPHAAAAGGGAAPSPAPSPAPASPAPSAPARPSPAAPAPPAAAPQADWGPIPQLHDDGRWWLDQMTNGQLISQPIDPSQYADYGIAAFPPAGSPDLVPLTLHDLDGFPLVFDPSSGAIEQDPSMGGTNVYRRGDSFVDARNGSTWTWFPTSQLLESSDGTLDVTVAQFSALA